MPVLSTPEIDILSAIKQIDRLLGVLNIAPVLEYRNIRYKLDIAHQPFMTILLTASSVTYEKLYLPENEAKFDTAYKCVEALLVSLQHTEILQAS